MSKKNVEWEWKKLGDVCEIVSGRNQKAVEVPNGKYPIYGSGGEMGRANSFICPAGCTIVGRKGSINNPIFVNEPFWNVDTAFGFSPKKNCNSFFLFYFCKSFDFYSMNKGTTIPSLVKADLLEISIPIPPLDEQERIVKVLDDAFEKIDAIKTTAETNLQNAKDLFQTTLANELSITDEKIKQGWEEKTLDDCCEITSVLVDPKETKYRKLLHVGGANIESETGQLLDLQTAEEENLISGKFLFDDTMILYSKIRPYLKKIVQPDFSGLCSADIYPLNVKRNMNKGFLFYTLFSEPFTDFANKNSARAGMPKINRESLFAYKFFLPPLPIQKQIVAKLDSLSEKVKQLESNYKQVLADCDELKKALLKQAFEGML